MSSQFLHNRGKTKKMVGTKETKDHYVTESVPKPVMMPVHVRGSAITKVGKYIKNKINLRSENVLYAKARSKSAGAAIPNASNYSNEYGDNELPPIQGREHIRVQTDVYLEELCDLIEEVDEQCQTDPLLDRPASPLFVPASSGTDVETQIWPGDLFDFDREVQPLLECVVGETLEQSLIEISAEEKLFNLEDQQREFEVRRNAEKAECLRLEEEERRLLEEKQRRLKEQDEAILLEEETTQKVAACVFAQNYLTDLLPKVYKRLERQGYFISQDTEIQEIEEDFWPWLIDEVDNEIATLEKSCHLLDSLLQDAVQNVTETAVIRPVTPTQYPERSVAEAESQVAEDEITQGEEEVPQEPNSEEP